jgi:antitoxin component YwqK of YwqJK toxin-antitoxin module
MEKKLNNYSIMMKKNNRTDNDGYRSTWTEVDEKYEGTWVVYYPNGQINEIANFKDGEFDGTYRCFYQNGTLQEETEYVNGKCHGESTMYHDSGEINYSTIHHEGKETYSSDGLKPEERLKLSIGKILLF